MTGAVFLPALACRVLTTTAAGTLPAGVDDILDGLMAAIDIKLKANAVKQEVEKIDELKKSAVRAVHTIHQLPGAGENATWTAHILRVTAAASCRHCL